MSIIRDNLAEILTELVQALADNATSCDATWTDDHKKGTLLCAKVFEPDDGDYFEAEFRGVLYKYPRQFRAWFASTVHAYAMLHHTLTTEHTEEELAMFIDGLVFALHAKDSWMVEEHRERIQRAMQCRSNADNRRISKNLEQEVQTLHAKGLTVRGIAKTLKENGNKISHTKVASIIKKHKDEVESVNDDRC